MKNFNAYMGNGLNVCVCVGSETILMLMGYQFLIEGSKKFWGI